MYFSGSRQERIMSVVTGLLPRNIWQTYLGGNGVNSVALSGSCADEQGD